jgi:hypothetical protein
LSASTQTSPVNQRVEHQDESNYLTWVRVKQREVKPILNEEKAF